MRIYNCGFCGYEGPCYGIPSSAGVSAPFCTQCQRNNKLTLVEDTEITRRTINGNLHLANMEVREYNDHIKVVIERLPEKQAVRITVYKGDGPKPISQEAYGNVSSNLDEHFEGAVSASSL